MSRFASRFIAFAAMMIFSSTIAEAVTFTNASLKGRYSFIVNRRNPDPTADQSVVLGLMTFDGIGAVTGNYVSVLGSPSGPSSSTSNNIVSGTYAVNADGSGTIAFTGGLNVAMRLDASAGSVARGAQLLVTTLSDDGSVNSGVAVQQSPAPKIYKTANLKGTFSYLQNRWTANTATGAGAQIGILTFDGKGHVKNDSVGMSSSTGPNTASTTGSYTVNADGTGTISYSGPTFAFVITGNGKEIQSVFTAPNVPGNLVISQTALKQ